MKTLSLVIAVLMAIVPGAYAQDAKAHLQDFTSRYTIDTLQISGDARYLKRRVIQLQKAEGIRSAYWDDESKLLTVEYNNKLVEPGSIKGFFSSNQSSTNTEPIERRRLRPAFTCSLFSSFSKPSKSKR